MDQPPPDVPAPLTVAASLTALEGAALVLLAVLELANVSGERVAMGLTTALFFALLGAGALVVAHGLRAGRGWSRGPGVMLQLIGLLLAWSFRGLWGVVAALVVVCGVALAGLLHPRSIDVLTRDRY